MTRVGESRCDASNLPGPRRRWRRRRFSYASSSSRRPVVARSAYDAASRAMQRGVQVAGVDPDVARSLARACHGGPSHPTSVVATWSQVSPTRPTSCSPAWPRQVSSSARSGTGTVRVTSSGQRRFGVARWQTPLPQPMTREKAQWLLQGVLERASTYNADPAKPIWVNRSQSVAPSSIVTRSTSETSTFKSHWSIGPLRTLSRPSSQTPGHRGGRSRASGIGCSGPRKRSGDSRTLNPTADGV